MDVNAKKTALRMIPYGLYIITGETKDGEAAASCINWVTQVSFEPPLVAVGIKADSNTHAVIAAAGAFALNVLGKGQNDKAYAFFKPVENGGGQGPHHSEPKPGRVSIIRRLLYYSIIR